MSAVVGLAPAASVQAAAAASAIVATAHPAPYGWQTHVVRPGDTLSDLAIAHRTTVGTLLAHNRLPGGASYLRLGQHLSVPRTESVARQAARAEALRWTSYTVRPGDTVGAIALRLGTSESGLLAANGLRRASVIHPGQRLRVSAKAVRAARAAAAPAMSTARVTVRSGDTVGALALRHGVSQASILKANGLSAGSAHRRGPLPAHPGGLRRALRQHLRRAHVLQRGRGRSGRQPRLPRRRAALPGRSDDPRDDHRDGHAGTASTPASPWPSPGRSRPGASAQVSVANAIGVMQVIPSSGAWASSLAGRRLDLLDTQDNITAGVVILRSLTRAAATEEQAVAGYYQGLAGVQAHGMYADTRAYVRSVLALKARM